MKELLKKFTVIILCIITILSSLNLQVFAEESDYKVALETDLNNYSSFTISSSGSYQGLFYSMHKILSLAIVIDFAQNDVKQDKNIGMTDTSVNTYRDKLVEKVEEFNKVFGDDGGAGRNEVEPIDLNLSYYNGEINITGITTEMATYMNTYLDSIIPDKNMDSSKDDEVLEGRKKTLSYCYDVIATTIDTTKTCSNHIPYTDTRQPSGEVLREPYYTYDISKNCSKLYDIMDPQSSVSSNAEDKDAKSRLLRKAKGISNADAMSITANTINSKLELLDRFFVNGTFSSGELSSAYYKLLACSAVYEPFISIAGESHFRTALEQLTGVSGDSNDLWKLYQSSYNYAKPLYYMKLDADGEPTGSATQINLEEFVDMIMNEESGSLVMAKGVLEQKADTDSYDYYIGGDAEWKIKDSQESSQSTNNSSENTNENTSNENTTNSNGSTGNQNTNSGNVNTNESGNTAPLQNGNSSSGDGNNNSSGSESNQSPSGGVSAKTVSYANVNSDTGTGETTTNSDANANVNEDESTNTNTPSGDEDTEDNSEKAESYASDGETITNKDNLTKPVFKWGVIDGKLSMGTVVMNNILRNISKLKTFTNEHTFLYMNPFGDIVTEDNTIILPGAANPTFYNKDQKYYPYTKAFFTSHPKLSYGTNVFKVSESSNLMTYVLSINAEKDDDDDSNEEHPVVSGNKVDEDNTYSVKAFPLHNKTTVVGNSGKFVDMGIQTDMHEIGEGITTMMSFKYYDFKAKGSGLNYFKAKIDGFWANNQKVSDPMSGETTYQAYMVLTPSQSLTNTAESTMYLDDLENVPARDLGTMAEIFYYALVDSEADDTETINDRLNMELLAEDVLTESLNGITNKDAHFKNYIPSTEEYVESSLNKIESFIRGVTKSYLKNFADITGVIGVKNAYQDTILGKLVYYGKVFYFVFIILILISTILRVLKNNLRFSQGIIVAVVLTLFSYLYVNIIPVYLPILLNSVQNNITLNLNYSILSTAMEDYATTYSNNIDSAGNYIYSTTSLNLYRLTGDEMSYLADTYGDTFCDGTNRPINGGIAGVFIQGNTVKVNLDVLIQNISIVGGYTRDSKNNKLYYKLESKKKVSSNIDYYTCYNIVLNNLIDTMNKHSKIYQIERGTLKYNVESSNPMTKDSFIFKSFIDSPLYLTPEDEEALAEEVEPEVLEQINEEFPNKLDWLGIENILIEKDTEYKGSLWYDTMRDNEYVYDSSMNLPESDLIDRQNTIAKVIEKTNRLTRVFVENHRDEIRLMSDENALKMVALYATCILNQQCGSWYNSNTLYPLFLNYEEFNLEDIMTACYASVQDRAEAESTNIVDYVLFKSGVISVIILTAVMTLTGINTIIIGLAYSVFYILAGISMIYRFSRSLDLNSLFSGYLKSTIIVFLCNLSQTIMFLLIKNIFIKNTLVALIFQAFISLLIFETLMRLLYAIIRNPSELGNSRMLEVMPRLLRKMHVDRLMANLGSLGHKLTGRRDATPFYEESDAYKEFRQGATLSDLYNSRNLSRRRASSINNIDINDPFFDNDHSNDNGS